MMPFTLNFVARQPHCNENAVEVFKAPMKNKWLEGDRAIYYAMDWKDRTDYLHMMLLPPTWQAEEEKHISPNIKPP